MVSVAPPSVRVLVCGGAWGPGGWKDLWKANMMMMMMMFIGTETLVTQLV